MPTLDAIQNKLGLTSEQVRTLVLRSPSVIGVEAVSIAGQLSTLDQRLHFFQNEGEQIMRILRLEQSLLKSLCSWNVSR